MQPEPFFFCTLVDMGDDETVPLGLQCKSHANHQQSKANHHSKCGKCYFARFCLVSMGSRFAVQGGSLHQSPLQVTIIIIIDLPLHVLKEH